MPPIKFEIIDGDSKLQVCCDTCGHYTNGGWDVPRYCNHLVGVLKLDAMCVCTPLDFFCSEWEVKENAGV